MRGGRALWDVYCIRGFDSVVILTSQLDELIINTRVVERDSVSKLQFMWLAEAAI